MLSYVERIKESKLFKLNFCILDNCKLCAILRKCTDRSYVPFSQFPPNGNIAKQVQYHN